MTRFSSTFALIGSIKSQSHVASPCHFLCIESATLFFHSPERVSDDEGCIVLRFIEILREVHFGAKHDIIPVFIKDLTDSNCRICLKSLCRFIGFRKHHSVPTACRHDKYFVYLSLCHAVVLGMGNVSIQLILHAVQHRQGSHSRQFTGTPVEIVTAEYVTEQMSFQKLVQCRSKCQHFS